LGAVVAAGAAGAVVAAGAAGAVVGAAAGAAVGAAAGAHEANARANKTTIDNKTCFFIFSTPLRLILFCA
jgi:hypothetical protein